MIGVSPAVIEELRARMVAAQRRSDEAAVTLEVLRIEGFGVRTRAAHLRHESIELRRRLVLQRAGWGPPALYVAPPDLPDNVYPLFGPRSAAQN